MIIRSAAMAVLLTAPALAAGIDPPPRLHRVAGAIEGTGETLVGSVRLDGWQSKFNIWISTGAVCTGFLAHSPTHGAPYGVLACADGRTARFRWATNCAEDLLSGWGTIDARNGTFSGDKLVFDERLPNSCGLPSR